MVGRPLDVSGHVYLHVTRRSIGAKKKKKLMIFHQFSFTHIFFGLFDTGSDLCLGGEGLIFAGVDLVFT